MVPQPAPAQRPTDPRHRVVPRRRFQESLRQLQNLSHRLVEEYEQEILDLRMQYGFSPQDRFVCERDSPIPPSLELMGDLSAGPAVPCSSSQEYSAALPCKVLDSSSGPHDSPSEALPMEITPTEMSRPTHRRHMSAILRQATSVLSEANANSSANLDGQSSSRGRLAALAQKLVVHPSSRRCTIWDSIGGLLISYDVVMIPMDYFPLSKDGFIDTMSLIVIGYWTMDVVVRFFFGYFDEGVAETAINKVAKNYLKTWFAPDFIVVFMDWLFLAMGLMSAATRSWRISRAVRAVRLLRLVRLIRLVKFSRLIGQAMDCLQSHMLVVAAKCVYLSLFVLLSAHYIACYWYAVGIWESIPVASWVQAHELESADAFTVYVFCMHWCLAQSGFGDVLTHPTNILERVYSIGSQLGWIVLISGTLCCCTNWMMEVREASCDFAKEEAKLRKFFLRHKLSAQLASRIVRFFRVYHRRRENTICESEVRVLPTLPLLLGIRLHHEMYLNHLKAHPAFDRFSQQSKIGIMSVCHLAMSEVFVNTGQDVFNDSDKAIHMLIVAGGSFQYYLAHCKQPRRVSPGSWLSEACLWVPDWLHKGTLVSSASSELVALNAEQLQAVISECEQAGWSNIGIRTYGQLFGQLATETEVTSDLCEDMACINDIAKEAFVQGEGEGDGLGARSGGFMALLRRRLALNESLSRSLTFGMASTVASNRSRRSQT